MSINTIPTELFEKILNYVPLRDARSIMLVDKEWYQVYQNLIRIQRQGIFEELLHSHFSDWNISVRMIIHLRWEPFLLDKLDSFCKRFNMSSVLSELNTIRSRLETEVVEIFKEAEVITKLLEQYEASSDFEGWYPDWLWKRRKKNRTNLAICVGNINHIKVLMPILARNAWFNGQFL
jgi:hypothetical protein